MTNSVEARSGNKQAASGPPTPASMPKRRKSDSLTVRPARVPTAEEFLEMLMPHIDRISGSENWSTREREMVDQYATSLTSGTAQVPYGMNDNLAREVQHRFAMSCVNMHIPSGTLPGQHMEWFDAALRHAEMRWRRMETMRRSARGAD